MNFRNPPPFPQGEPAFVDGLRKAIDYRARWNMNLVPKAGEADFRTGLDLKMEYPDPEGLLLTVEQELRRFFSDANLLKKGSTPIITRKTADLQGEAFRLTVSAESILVEAGDTEGIRRGLYYVEDQFAGSPAPFLPLGSSTHKNWLKNRISRCFFGPIKRPPFNRDELMDEIDYYPEEYLNLLAREGVNGLWLTIVFREICTTSLYPRNPDAGKRIEKLRRTVEKCRRYGIKVWTFCIEPYHWCKTSNPCPENHLELKGPDGYIGSTFCPNSETAQNYLYECTNSLFSAVPDLGGLITISHGERPTSCLSTLSVLDDKKNPCDGKCSLGIGDILAKVLRPMADGMRAASPKAELISWLYMPYVGQLADWIYQMPEKLTKDIILAFNFESGCNKNQLGKVRNGGDYWLSCVGPSDRFGRMAQAARGHCSMAAKLQVCCSHEAATIPFVPVPGLIYRKYKAMKRLGVEHVIQCWYFGNYPGLMNKAAGRLAYEDFEGTEEHFLETLAHGEWGRRAPEMAAVWKTFSDAYTHYPLDIQFQYYGPMHDGPVWPLHLKQVMRQLPRTWKPDYEPAGDAVGESMFNHELKETALLTRQLSEEWHKGMKAFQVFQKEYMEFGERRKDACLMEALDIQFRSGANILEFYLLRSRLMESSADSRIILDRMEEIMKEEIGLSRRLAELCEQDPRLGYHSEAEVYKYFPGKLLWRAEWLEHSLATDFPECREKLMSGIPAGEILRKKLPLHQIGTEYESGAVRWKADATIDTLRITTVCRMDQSAVSNEGLKFFLMDRNGEKTPWMILMSMRNGEHYDFFSAAEFHLEERGNEWQIILDIPRAMLWADEICFGIQHEWTDGSGKFCVENYPVGDYVNEQRLNLGFFTPDRMILLNLNPV